MCKWCGNQECHQWWIGIFWFQGWANLCRQSCQVCPVTPCWVRVQSHLWMLSLSANGLTCSHLNLLLDSGRSSPRSGASTVGLNEPKGVFHPSWVYCFMKILVRMSSEQTGLRLYLTCNSHRKEEVIADVAIDNILGCRDHEIMNFGMQRMFGNENCRVKSLTLQTEYLENL